MFILNINIYFCKVFNDQYYYTCVLLYLSRSYRFAFSLNQIYRAIHDHAIIKINYTDQLTFNPFSLFHGYYVTLYTQIALDLIISITFSSFSFISRLKRRHCSNDLIGFVIYTYCSKKSWNSLLDPHRSCKFCWFLLLQ